MKSLSIEEIKKRQELVSSPNHWQGRDAEGIRIPVGDDGKPLVDEHGNDWNDYRDELMRRKPKEVFVPTENVDWKNRAFDEYNDE